MTNYMTYLFNMCDSKYVQPNLEAIVKHCKYILRLTFTWSGHHAIKIAIHKPIQNFIIFLKHIYYRHLHVNPKTFNAITHSLKCNLQSCLVKTVDMLLMKT